MSCMTLDESFNLFEYWGCNKGHNDVLSDQCLWGTSADSPLVTYPFYIRSHALLGELAQDRCMTWLIGGILGFWPLWLMKADYRIKPSKKAGHSSSVPLRKLKKKENSHFYSYLNVEDIWRNSRYIDLNKTFGKEANPKKSRAKNAWEPGSDSGLLLKPWLEQTVKLTAYHEPFISNLKVRHWDLDFRNCQ